MTLDSSAQGFEEKFALLKSKGIQRDPAIIEAVTHIINEVRQKGDDALLALTKKYDGGNAESIKDLTYSKDDFADAYESLLPEQAMYLEQAKDNITYYHNFQIQHSWYEQINPQHVMGQKIVPLQRVGIYVPGGSALYPSSVLMGAIPAHLAGVDEVIVVSPAQDGNISKIVLAAAHLAQVDTLYCIGGAQAVAALALGTTSINKVDKIAGPGNQYVTEAKRQLYGEVGIDTLAGPSEVAIVADEHATPDWIVLDMFAQAEHSPDTRVVLFSDNSALLSEVEKGIKEAIVTQHRKENIEHSLQNNGALVKTTNIAESVALADSLAPEHLQLMLQKPDEYKDSIRFASAVFCGYYASAVYGDYAAGPNHILPTGAAGRFSSPLGVYDFIKRISFLQLSQPSAMKLTPMAAEMAKDEGLLAHAAAVKIRVEKPPTLKEETKEEKEKK